MNNQLEAVMLVDDNEIDNIINQKMIESCGKAKVVYTHTSAKSALEFLKSLEKLPEAIRLTAVPEVLFLDINMPIMDGFQFLAEFETFSEKIKKRCKVVLLTTSMNPNDQQAANENPHVSKYFHKPLTEEMIMDL